MGELVQIGTSFDVAIFQDGSPVFIATLVQSSPNLVDCFISDFGTFDAQAAAELLEMVGKQIVEHAGSFSDDDDDPFQGAADFDIPF